MNLINLDSQQHLHLPDDLLWVDEYAWTPATSSVSYLLTGALLVQSGTRQSGRPITLIAAPDMAWVTRTTLNTLYDWAALPLSADSGRFELQLRDGRTFTVAFRHQDTALEAEPVKGFPAHSDDEPYRITMRLMHI